ncbi:MAG: hypothetical protein ACYCZ2_01535 [Lutibacter sp.]
MITKRKQENWSLGEIIIGVIAVIGIIFFIGELFGNNKEEDLKESETQPEKDLDKKKKRLTIVTTKIEELNPQRNKLIKTERIILVGSRVVIATILVTVNIAYFWFNNWHFDLGAQLNINGAILLSYSFVAFIIYGNPDTLVKEVKRKSKKRLKRKHIHILSELENLEKEKDVLIMEIEELEVLEKVEEASFMLLEEPADYVELNKIKQANTKELVP